MQPYYKERIKGYTTKDWIYVAIYTVFGLIGFIGVIGVYGISLGWIFMLLAIIGEQNIAMDVLRRRLTALENNFPNQEITSSPNAVLGK